MASQDVDVNGPDEGIGCAPFDLLSVNSRLGNVASSLQLRERGIQGNHGFSNKKVLEEAAEYRLVMKNYTERACEIPGVPRSTFLMVFSPDGSLVASTHGNHNVYVNDLATGKHVRTLSGHPRTPWCVSFHPSQSQLLASGCLGGQVRVWDLSGGSEVWTNKNETVIASIAFHPRNNLLVIATYNELYFWDWAHSQPYMKVQTSSIKEKVRFVSFDALGHKLITGISLRTSPSVEPPSNFNSSAQNNNRDRDQNLLSPDNTERLGRLSGRMSEVHERIVTSYHNLVQRYDSLMRNYHRLFLSRSQTTTDRGTDPMEVEGDSTEGRNSARTNLPPFRLPYARPLLLNRVNPLISGATSDNVSDNSDSDTGSNDTALNLRTLSLDNNLSEPTNSIIHTTDNPASPENQPEPTETSGTTETMLRRSIFGSAPSAFQPTNTSESRLADHGPRIIPLNNPNNPPPESLGPRTGTEHYGGNNAFRFILAASVSRLQRYMENSIDETINFWDRYERMGRDPGFFQDSVLNDLAQHLHHHLEDNERAVFSNVCRRGNMGNFERTDNESNNSDVISTIAQGLGNIRKLIHDAELTTLGRNPGASQNRHQTIPNTARPRREIYMYRQLHTPSQQSEARRLRNSNSSSRNELFSSEDSDSDWEIFRPLRVNIYRTRNWNSISNNPNDPSPGGGDTLSQLRSEMRNLQTSTLPIQLPAVPRNTQPTDQFDVRFSDRRFMIQNHTSNPSSDSTLNVQTNLDPISPTSRRSDPDIIFNIFSSVRYLDDPEAAQNANNDQSLVGENNEPTRTNAPSNSNSNAQSQGNTDAPQHNNSNAPSQSNIDAPQHSISYVPSQNNTDAPLQSSSEAPTQNHTNTPPQSNPIEDLHNENTQNRSRHNGGSLNRHNHGRNNNEHNRNHNNEEFENQRHVRGCVLNNRHNNGRRNRNRHNNDHQAFNDRVRQSFNDRHSRERWNRNHNISDNHSNDRNNKECHNGDHPSGHRRNNGRRNSNHRNVDRRHHDRLNRNHTRRYRDHRNGEGQNEERRNPDQPNRHFSSGYNDDHRYRDHYGRHNLDRRNIDRRNVNHRNIGRRNKNRPTKDPREGNPSNEVCRNEDCCIDDCNGNCCSCEDSCSSSSTSSSGYTCSCSDEECRADACSRAADRLNNDQTPNANSRQTNPSDRNRPSTSGRIRLTEQQRQKMKITENSYYRVLLGVNALEHHTSTLSNIWTSGTPRSPLRLLRMMWEDLRREMVRLQRRLNGNTGPKHCYKRSTLARCHMLNHNQNSQSGTASTSAPNHPSTNVSTDEIPTLGTENDNNTNENNANQVKSNNSPHKAVQSESNSSPRPSGSGMSRSARIHSSFKGKKILPKRASTNCSNSSTSTEATDRNRDLPSTSSVSRTIHRQAPKSYIIPRHRDSNSYPPRNLRTRSMMKREALRRRLRTAMIGLANRLPSPAGRIPPRPWPRLRRATTSTRNRELYCTRDGIRARSTQILGIFFDLMMGCLNLSALEKSLVKVLQMLKRSLSLTCLLLVPHMRDNRDQQAARTESVHPEPSTSTSHDNRTSSILPSIAEAAESSGHSELSGDAPKSNSTSKLWSDRLAIQISAANRNFSIRAKKRKELYNQNRRLKVLLQSVPNDFEDVRSLGSPSNGQDSNLRQLSSRSIPISKRKLKNAPRPSQPKANDTKTPKPSTSQVTSRLGTLSSRWSNNSPSMRAFRMRVRNIPMERMSHTPSPSVVNSNPTQERVPSNDTQGNRDNTEQNRDDSHSSDTEPVVPRRMARFRFFTIGSGNNPNQDSPNDPNRQNTSNNNHVPLVQINDVPVNDLHPNGHIRLRREYVRTLHMNHIEDSIAGFLEANPGLVAEVSCPMHRIQVWDISNDLMPDISNAEKNVVVEKCRIHNDASVDVSRDGKLIVALLPAQRFRINRVAIYSLEWTSLGQCLYLTHVEQNPVSVALSPCGLHLAVGLGSRRVTLIPSGRSGVMAVIYRLVNPNTDNAEPPPRGSLVAVRNLEQFPESNFTSINCLRWAPQPGQGLVYANNTGQLRILS